MVVKRERRMKDERTEEPKNRQRTSGVRKKRKTNVSDLMNALRKTEYCSKNHRHLLYRHHPRYRRLRCHRHRRYRHRHRCHHLPYHRRRYHHHREAHRHRPKDSHNDRRYRNLHHHMRHALLSILHPEVICIHRAHPRASLTSSSKQHHHRDSHFLNSMDRSQYSEYRIDT